MSGGNAVPGTNPLRDLMRNVLHNKFPRIEANGFWTDHTEFRWVSLVFQRRDTFVMRAEVVVMESELG